MDQKSHLTVPLSEPLAQGSAKRDSAKACRDKAVENLALAVSMPTGAERALLERTAAAWSMRAVQLERPEARLAAELPESGSEVDHVRL